MGIPRKFLCLFHLNLVGSTVVGREISLGAKYLIADMMNGKGTRKKKEKQNEITRKEGSCFVLEVIVAESSGSC